MELFNELPEAQEQGVEDFLTFINIYESKRRFRSLRSLLRKNRNLIRGGVCMEAGAGRGLFAREMVELGARKVYAVERSPVLFELLKVQCEGLSGIELVAGDVEDFEPKDAVDVLFHEFYGSLILDESILCLEELAFVPGMILPDGGRLWAMPVRAEDLKKDELYEPAWKEVLSGALISDLITGVKFQPVWQVFDWRLGTGRTTFRFKMPEDAEFIAMCGEITHQGKSVLRLWQTYNWPIIFTPVSGKEFEMHFDYQGGYSDVYFNWIK